MCYTGECKWESGFDGECMYYLYAEEGEKKCVDSYGEEVFEEVEDKYSLIWKKERAL